LNRKAVLAITLTLLLTSMLTLALNIHSARAELTDRNVGISVGYWIQYGISVMWESNDPNATAPQYVLDSQQLVFISNVVQSVSGTNVTFSRIMLFKNGTQKSETYWIDVDTGHGSGYLSFVSANLSAGDIIYTGLGKGIGEINETITRTYLGELVEINHHNSTTSGTSYSIYAEVYWNRATGVLYEMYINHTDCTTKGEETYVTQETQWLYPIGLIGVAKTWTVNDNGPADYLKIQDAINAANSGDTIFVHSGTYYENVIVNKTVSLIGENKFNTVVDGNNTGTVVTVTANNVNITEFTFQNGCGEWHSGIALSYVEHCNISGNDISNNEFGLLFVYANNSRITNNNMTNNGFGIFLLVSSNNTFRGNKMVENAGGFGVLGEDLSDFINDVDSSNTIDGKPIYYWVNKRDRTVPLDAGYVALVNCTLITIQGLTQTEAVQLIYTTNSTITNNIVSFSLYYSSNNIILRNNFTHSGHGIYLSGSSNNIISENNITANSMFGILLWVSSNNSVTRNNIADNGYDGIYLYSCSNNTITGNNLANNGGGIRFLWASNNYIYHNNFINNTYPVHTLDSENTWDNSFEGNYWSDYEEKYPDAQELDGSGIWDTPYTIDWDNRDNFPLIQPWSPKPSNPVKATQELVETIETWNLPKGTGNSLKAKLKVAIHMLDLGEEDGAIRKLTAFINRIEMLREKTLTNQQADKLVLEAQRIIALINGLTNQLSFF